MPQVTDALEAAEIAKKMLESSGYTFYHIGEIRQVDSQFWEVKAITLTKTIRMKINGQEGKVIELISE